MFLFTLGIGLCAYGLFNNIYNFIYAGIGVIILSGILLF